MKRTLIITLMILLSQGILFAQTTAKTGTGKPSSGTISGYVKDSTNSAPVEYANIVLYNSSDSGLVTGTITDSKGFFLLKNIPGGKYYLIVDFIGFLKKSVGINITSTNNEIRLKIIMLNRVAYNLKNVEIIEEKSPIEYKIDKKVINVGQQLTSAGGTAADALQNAPSITLDADGNILLRGSQSFRVLVDGKPSAMNGNDLLKQIPANTIDKIEIITNPSAKYDPDGTAGIINIIQKKQTKQGINGIINASIATRDKYTLDCFLNYRLKKFNFWGAVDYQDINYPSDMESETYIYSQDTTEHDFTQIEQFVRVKHKKIRTGMDYYLNQRDIFSFSANAGLYDLYRYFDYTSTVSYDPGAINYFVYDNDYLLKGKYLDLNLDFQRKFDQKGHEITASAFYSGWWSDMDELGLTHKTAEDWVINSASPDQMRSYTTMNRGFYRFKIDYNRPLKNNQKIESGLQTILTPNDGSYKLDRYNPGLNDWLTDSIFTNSHSFYRNIYSSYSTFSGKLKKIDFKIGLRLEYTDRLLKQITTGKEYKLERADYFPTLHLSKQLKKNQQIQASYSRRVDRPMLRFLKPYPDFSDRNSVSQGNPALKPSFTDSYELNYLNRMKSSYLTANLYHRFVRNQMARTIILGSEGTIVVSYDNIGRSFASGLELSGNFEIKKWFSLIGNINFFKYNVNSNIGNTAFSDATWSWTGYISPVFKATPLTRIQLTGYYIAPSLSGQGTISDYFIISAAVVQNIFKRKVSITLNVKDIFSTFKMNIKSESAGIKSNWLVINEAPVVTLNLSYRINNYKRSSNAQDNTNPEFEGGIF